MGKIWKEDFRSVDELLVKLQKHRYWKKINKATLRLIFDKLHENSVYIPNIIKDPSVVIDDMQRIRDFLIISEEYNLVKNNYVKLARSDVGMSLGILHMFAVTLERLGASIAQDYPYSNLSDEEVTRLMVMAEMSYGSSILCDRYLFESYFGVAFCCCVFMDIDAAQLWAVEFDEAVKSLNGMDEANLSYSQKSIKQDTDRIKNVKNMIEEMINEHRKMINHDSIEL